MRADRAGLGLVEVVVAMMIGSMALIAMAGVMASTATAHLNSESRMEYLSIGEAKLDQLRFYSALRQADTVQLSLGGSLTTNVANKFEHVTTPRGRLYTVRWLVVSGLNGTRDVTVRVAPADRNRNEASYMDLRALMSIE